jgi:hypothetical protein
VFKIVRIGLCMLFFFSAHHLNAQTVDSVLANAERWNNSQAIARIVTARDSAVGSLTTTGDSIVVVGGHPFRRADILRLDLRVSRDRKKPILLGGTVGALVGGLLLIRARHGLCDAPCPVSDVETFFPGAVLGAIVGSLAAGLTSRHPEEWHTIWPVVADSRER